MAGFEEEAFERARRMSHNRPGGAAHREEHREEPPKPKPEPKPERPPKPPEPPKPPAPKPKPPNVLETLFQDKEKSLILMLLMLLMDENADPTLLFTLMYLLME